MRYGNGTGAGEFQKLSTGTGFSTELVRNTKLIIFYIKSDFLTFLKVKVWFPCFPSERKIVILLDILLRVRVPNMDTEKVL